METHTQGRAGPAGLVGCRLTDSKRPARFQASPGSSQSLVAAAPAAAGGPRLLPKPPPQIPRTASVRPGCSPGPRAKDPSQQHGFTPQRLRNRSSIPKKPPKKQELKFKKWENPIIIPSSSLLKGSQSPRRRRRRRLTLRLKCAISSHFRHKDRRPSRLADGHLKVQLPLRPHFLPGLGG